MAEIVNTHVFLGSGCNDCRNPASSPSWGERMLKNEKDIWKKPSMKKRPTMSDNGITFLLRILEVEKIFRAFNRGSLL